MNELARPTLALPRTAWRRAQLFELCDQSWLPEVLRRAETDYLATVIRVAEPFAPLGPKLAEVLDRAGVDRIVDLASGGAGPWPGLARRIADARGGRAPEVTLTDLYPNERAFGRARAAGLAYEEAPVDARDVAPRLTGVRTIFDGLHHLAPADAHAVLADAHRRRAPIVVGEAMPRRWRVLLTVPLIPLLVLLMTPRIRPVSAVQLLFTYLIPILPLIIMWDGFVSCLRTYRPAELLALAQGLDGYRWDAGTLRHRAASITYLVGEPTDAPTT